MTGLGAMVAAGASLEELDRMDISDVMCWYEILMAYHKEANGTIGAGGSRS